MVESRREVTMAVAAAGSSCHDHVSQACWRLLLDWVTQRGHVLATMEDWRGVVCLFEEYVGPWMQEGKYIPDRVTIVTWGHVPGCRPGDAGALTGRQGDLAMETV